MSGAKIGEPIDLPFWLWTRVKRMKHKFNRIRQANTAEPSVCGDTALCVKLGPTLTTCYYYCGLFHGSQLVYSHNFYVVIRAIVAVIFFYTFSKCYYSLQHRNRCDLRHTLHTFRPIRKTTSHVAAT